MIHLIKYNSQRNNLNFQGKFMGWNQCFTTCSWMFMSFFSNEIDATDDIILAAYLDDIEDSIGKPGIGERIKRKYNWIRGNTSYWWLVQKAGIEKWLWERGIKGGAVFRENISFLELLFILENQPVILQTRKMGGLRGGHIILAIGYTGEEIICHDPFGNAISKYKFKDGSYMSYPIEWLKRYTGKKIRCIYWRGYE